MPQHTKNLLSYDSIIQTLTSASPRHVNTVEAVQIIPGVTHASVRPDGQTKIVKQVHVYYEKRKPHLLLDFQAKYQICTLGIQYTLNANNLIISKYRHVC